MTDVLKQHVLASHINESIANSINASAAHNVLAGDFVYMTRSVEFPAAKRSSTSACCYTRLKTP